MGGLEKDRPRASKCGEVKKGLIREGIFEPALWELNLMKLGDNRRSKEREIEGRNIPNGVVRWKKVQSGEGIFSACQRGTPFGWHNQGHLGGGELHWMVQWGGYLTPKADTMGSWTDQNQWHWMASKVHVAHRQHATQIPTQLEKDSGSHIGLHSKRKFHFTSHI